MFKCSTVPEFPGRSNPDPMRETPERILEAAERCMNRYGFAASMGDVASEAGLSRGSVYRHFGDRDALVQAVLARAADRFLATVAAEVDRKRTLAGQFAAAITVVAARAEATGGAGTTDLDAPGSGRRTTPHDLVARPDSVAMAERWLAFWASRVDAARARGELRPDVEGRAAAEWLTRVLLSFVVAPALDVDPADPRAVRRFVDRHLLHGLTA
jgi:AcrR family transcriptional regulator